MKSYNRKDLSPEDDFVCPCVIKEYQKGVYRLYFLPNDDAVRPELDRFFATNTGRIGLFKLKIESKKAFFCEFGE